MTPNQTNYNQILRWNLGYTSRSTQTKYLPTEITNNEKVLQLTEGLSEMEYDVIVTNILDIDGVEYEEACAKLLIYEARHARGEGDSRDGESFLSQRGGRGRFQSGSRRARGRGVSRGRGRGQPEERKCYNCKLPEHCFHFQDVSVPHEHILGLLQVSQSCEQALVIAHMLCATWIYNPSRFLLVSQIHLTSILFLHLLHIAVFQGFHAVARSLLSLMALWFLKSLLLLRTVIGLVPKLLALVALWRFWAILSKMSR